MWSAPAIRVDGSPGPTTHPSFRKQVTMADDALVELTPDWAGVSCWFRPANKSDDDDDIIGLHFNDPSLGQFRLVLTPEQSSWVAYSIKLHVEEYVPPA